MKLLLLACVVSTAWLVLLAGAVMVNRIVDDVRRYRSRRNRMEQNRPPHVGGHKEITDGHA